MKLHRNARSTPITRQLLVDRVLRQGWTYAAAGEAAGMSRRTVGKWVQRFRHGGAEALADRSSRPGRPRHQTPAHVVALIRQLRVTHALPAWALGRALGVPRGRSAPWGCIGGRSSPRRPFIPKDNSFALDAAAGQLNLFASLGVRAATARQVNEALTTRVEAAKASRTPEAGDKAVDKTPHVVVFAGHRFDESGRAVPRFPVSSEKAAYEAIRTVLASMTETDNIVGLASAAPGADILFHEACKELGVATTVCLPMMADQYVGTVGQDLSWRSRLVGLLDEKRKLTPPAVLELADMPGLPRWLEGTNTNEWERGNMWILQMARTLGPRKVTLLALWDEQPIGDGPGGTAHIVSLARGQADVNIEIIRTTSLHT